MLRVPLAVALASIEIVAGELNCALLAGAERLTVGGVSGVPKTSISNHAIQEGLEVVLIFKYRTLPASGLKTGSSHCHARVYAFNVVSRVVGSGARPP